MELKEYYDNVNLYPHLFKMDLDKAREIKVEDVKYMLDTCPCSNTGLFCTEVDLERVSKIKDAYLIPSDGVMELYKELKTKVPQAYSFLWYRRTDKLPESTCMEPIDFLRFFQKNNPGLPVVYRTDEINFMEVADRFFNGSAVCLSTIKTTNNADYLDLNLVDDAAFYAHHGMFKIKYLQYLLALTLVAADSEMYFATNTNINSWVIQNRGHFERQFIFKNDKDLLYPW